MLTSLPVLAFATFGALAPRLARLAGVHRLTFLALVGVVVGLYGRARVESVPVFLLLSLVALAGMATANVLLPSLVKLHFPDRVGLMTAAYSTALAVGLTSASVLTVPVGAAYDGWRSGLLVWAVTAGIAALPWIALVRHDRTVPTDPETARASRAIGLGDVARTRLGWLMALFFGLQSMQAYSIFGWFAEIYRDAGFAADTAGLLLGVVTGITIPLSFVVPALAARRTNQSVLMWAVMACYPVGYLGLIVAPHAGALVWAVFVGIGTCTFPLILTLIGLRARTPEGTAALSGFTQSAGYLLGDRRPVRRRPAARRLRRLDGAAAGADGAQRPAAARRAGALPAGVRRGRAARVDVPARHWMSAATVIPAAVRAYPRASSHRPASAICSTSPAASRAGTATEKPDRQSPRPEDDRSQ